MLRHLHIENYALIDALDVEFHPGLNLLTGETGSGKSIVVEALGLLLGDKASLDLVRSGTERARVSAVFSPLPTRPPAATRWERLVRLLAESGNELADGDDLVIQRDIQAGGKSRVFVNHQPATVSLVRALAPLLAEVHGQNEQQELFTPAAQLQALDRFAGLEMLAATVREHYEQWKALRAEQDDLARSERERLRQMDLWRFQMREIEQAGLSEQSDPAEDERLEEEKLLLANAARIQARLAASFDLLYESETSAAAAIAAAQRNLDEVAPYDATLVPLAGELQSARVSVQEAALALRDRLAGLDSSPQRLEEVENRLALLDQLKRKYGPTLADVIRYGREVFAKHEGAESAASRRQVIETQVKEAAAAYRKSAGELSRWRKEAAANLKKEVERELKDLAMKGTVLEIRLIVTEAEEGWRASGLDTVEFLISPNPGEPLRPFSRIASGGELSRTMLALETAIQSRSRSQGSDHTLVFDEVDSGIGGRAAETVGRKLRQLGEGRQVLCVTHLPQIASFAHHHYRVEKGLQNGRTVTQVQYLNQAGRAEELARMLSGSQITDAVMKHAAQLLKANS